MGKAALLGRCNCGGTHFTLDSGQFPSAPQLFKNQADTPTEPLFARCSTFALNVIGPVSSYRMDPQQTRHFCPLCGSILFISREPDHEKIDIALSALDDCEAVITACA